MTDAKLGFAENFGLSGCAAVVSKTAAAPIERVKLLLQAQDESMRQGRLAQPYKGAFDCAVKTVRSEGVFPLWRGNLTNCLRYFPTQALNFAVKDACKAAFRVPADASRFRKNSSNFLSGACAGSLSNIPVYSLDYARTRLANDVLSADGRRQYKGLVDVYAKTLASDGFGGLYRGFVVSCVNLFVYRGLYFGLYDSLKPVLLSPDAGLTLSFLLGYAVTVTSGIVTYPLDTIRRRMMMTCGTGVKYEGSIDCGLRIWKNEGFLSLMKGAGANILRGVSGAGVLAGFDAFKKLYIVYRLQ